MKRLAWIPGKRREKGRSTEISDYVCVLKNQMIYVIHFGPLWCPPAQ